MIHTSDIPVDIQHENFYRKQYSAHKKSLWRLTLLFFIIMGALMTGSILFLLNPTWDRYPMATSWLLCFGAGAFFMATLITLKAAMKTIYKNGYSFYTILILLALLMGSCKKESASKSANECFVCTDQAGEQLNVICAPTEDSALVLLNTSCPGGCGYTMQQFHNKCPNQ